MKEGREAKAEDWCFVCKDGGDLILCDDHKCSKVYHLECVGFDEESTFEIEETWTCDCHCCFTCKGASEVQCFCCPTSFCRNCIKFVKFAALRDNKGLCIECWTLVRLAENLSSSKKYVDFEDRETHEGLFKEYWEIVKEQEGLTRADLVSAEAFSNAKMGSTPLPSRVQKKTVQELSFSNVQKFCGWGSKPLIDFLTSIGVDTTKQLSQQDVRSIIFDYIQEKDLIHPIKKNKVICDKNMHLVFKKNTVPMKHIDVLLGSHFSQITNNANKRCLESDQHQQNGEPNKQHKTLSCSECEEKKEKGYLASVVAHNMNLVYLRRSLVEDLLKHPESFEDKLVGSFVKVVKAADSCCKRKISQQLLQVTAVKRMSSRDGRDNFVLQVWTLPDIQISMLSDSDLTEEDCQDLRDNMAKGLLHRPTVEEIEKKAQTLHQDIRKHWMERELVNLQNRIDRANEKGRRSEYPFVSFFFLPLNWFPCMYVCMFIGVIWVTLTFHVLVLNAIPTFRAKTNTEERSRRSRATSRYHPRLIIHSCWFIPIFLILSYNHVIFCHY